MRFATIRTAFGPRAALFDGAGYVDLHAADPFLPPILIDLLAAGPSALERARNAATHPSAHRHGQSSVTLLPPIPEPRKIICIGLNYRDHAAESGAPIPKEPILFSKFPTALVGHEANIVLPTVSNEVDYEAELVIVVGKRGKPRSIVEAAEYIAGYTIGHDVSARDWQLKKEGKQWTIGKTFDTFAPCGPVLVTADEVPDPTNLAIRLRLNGVAMQDSSTKQMIFSPVELLVYLAQVFTLEPGDLIFTGTPPGVGFARKPPVFLKPGDVVEIEIERLGVLRNRCVSA
jgi:2-keto-4-pentenoate hydratase/2-oxohepta-3-ene-1,7-dioic acid hydratase in catechol pathway